MAHRDAIALPGGLSLSTRHLVLALVMLALVVRLIHFLIILPGPMVTYHRTAPESDMYVFDQWARKIARGDLFSRQLFYALHPWQLEAAPPQKWMEWYGAAPIFFKAPIYPYLIAFLYWLFGEALLPVVALQIAASSISVLLLFRITKRLFDATSALFAALFFCLYAPVIHYAVFMLRESWLILLSLIITDSLSDFRLQPTVRKACALGFGAGVLILLSESSFTLPLLLALLLASWFRDINHLAKLESGLLAGLVTAFVPLVARNLIVGAPAISLSALGSAIFAVSNAADSYPYFFTGSPPSLLDIMEKTHGSPLATVWATLGTFHGDLGAIGLFYARKAVGLVMPFEYPDNANFYYAALKDPLLSFLPGYSLLLPLSLIGAAFATRISRNCSALLPVALSLIIAMMMSHPNSRYRAVLAVYLMPFAGLVLAQITQWTKERRLVPTAAALSACLLIFLGTKTLEQRLVFNAEPVEVFKYRPIEFSVGSEVYAREKRYPEAIGELLQLARLNPDPAIRSRALLMAANYRRLSSLPEDSSEK